MKICIYLITFLSVFSPLSPSMNILACTLHMVLLIIQLRYHTECFCFDFGPAGFMSLARPAALSIVVNCYSNVGVSYVQPTPFSHLLFSFISSIDNRFFCASMSVLFLQLENNWILIRTICSEPLWKNARYEWALLEKFSEILSFDNIFTHLSA